MLRFEDESGGRWYSESQDKYDNGDKYISVTLALSIVQSFELQNWFKKTSAGQIEKKSQAGLDRGALTHNIIENMTKGVSVDVPQEVKPAIDAYIALKEKHKIVSISDGSEIVVYHTGYGYAGTVDQVGEFEGKKTIMDYKTGRHYSIKTGWQLAAYKYAYEHMTNSSNLGMVGIFLPNEEPAKVFKYQHYESCFMAFLSALYCFKMTYWNKLGNWKYLRTPILEIHGQDTSSSKQT